MAAHRADQVQAICYSDVLKPDAVTARIELDPSQFKPDATASLGDFSHIEIVFHFDRVPDAEIHSGARHPRGRKDWPLVGIFAQRGKGRPNRQLWEAYELAAEPATLKELPPNHWFAGLRGVESLFLRRGRVNERFLLYDAELNYPLPLRGDDFLEVRIRLLKELTT